MTMGTPVRLLRLHSRMRDTNCALALECRDARPDTRSPHADEAVALPAEDANVAYAMRSGLETWPLLLGERSNDVEGRTTVCGA